MTSMLETACATVSATALLVTPLADAVMFALPSATAVTAPSPATVATPVASEAQVNVTPLIVVPPESLATALSACVAPIVVSVTGPAGVTSMLTASWLTTSSAESRTCASPSAAAITQVSPLANARNTPFPKSSATSASRADQVTAWPEISSPLGSRTRAVYVAVSPRLANATRAGSISTLATR